ncbi:hypothetical protein EN932_30270 [Mesorhizobium sp. M7A.F.Ca.US.002.01.1.1]|uniref:hypothetical protein n=1 Tax=Mesorhizobium sp. M7A.F.Ca.US.002.01.1.1 TaxID=2496700 RepID=UPI000FD4A896|nr:hypothetical protein [Mesorhizobium sp. M7A.F.Ca.US.002.01.1.1]RVA05095.1 hypothetical protein EN932_30270 [Mesorhizobium sp. M7A.F.Ca.US.002.01.1.1]
MNSAIDLSERPGATEVSSFVILPPSGAFRAGEALRAIEAFLTERFPGLAFYANADIPPFDGDYKLVPIVGVPGDEPDSIRMLNSPSDALLLAIGAALKLFRPAGLVVN